MTSKNITNAQMQVLFRCRKAEFALLKHAFKEQMQQTFVNDRPIISQLLSVADPDGSLRESMWNAVAESSSVLNSMLSGDRWGSHKPDDFEYLVAGAKAEIRRSLNHVARQNRIVEDVGAAVSRRVSDISDMSRTSQTPTLPTTTARRVSERLKNKAKGRLYPPRLFPNNATSSSVERSPVTTNEDGYESELTRYEVPGGENLVVGKSDSKPYMTPDIPNCLDSSNGSPKGSESPGDGSLSLENRRLPDPLLDSPERTVSQRLQLLVRGQRLTLSARIQQAVDRGIADLEDRLTKNVEVMLAERDAEIERLKAGLERERAWRDL